MKAAKQLSTRKANAALLAQRLMGRLGPSARASLPAADFQIDLKAAAAAMLMSEDEWLEQLCDGRKASGPAESWAAQCVGGKTCVNKNEKGYDVDHPDLGRISVKCLTKSKVCFEMSVDVGAGRGAVSLTAQEQALPEKERKALTKQKKKERSMASIAQAAWHAVVDIRHAPDMRVVLVPAAWLLAHCEAGTLDCFGWQGERFYALLSESYDLAPLDLGRRMPNAEERLAIVEGLLSKSVQPSGGVISKADRARLLKAEREVLKLEQKAAKKAVSKRSAAPSPAGEIPASQSAPSEIKFELTPSQRALVDEANRLSEQASISGHAPSREFIERCASEQGSLSEEAGIAMSEDPSLGALESLAARPSKSRGDSNQNGLS